MAEARNRADRGTLAVLMAHLGNCHGGKKGGRPFKASDFDPEAKAAERREGIPLTGAVLRALKPRFAPQPTRKAKP